MRHIGLAALLVWVAGLCPALDIEDHARFGPPDAPHILRVISTADTEFFTPTLAAFVAENADLAIDYTVVSSADLMTAIETTDGAFDIAISSAMDLQTKLANDGLAQRHVSAATQSAPEWAVWNDMLFAFTQEPATIVLSKSGFDDLPLPKTRQDLIGLLRQHPDRFLGRIGTYDIRRSGLGYLFATQDSRTSETYWRLTEVFGTLDAKLYCCSSDMIKAVRSGELLIAYNVLGSYAANRADREAFEIILPADFTTLMLRTALIPDNAARPDLSGRFIDHLLAQAHAPNAPPVLTPDVDLGPHATAPNRIRIGPGLLVFLDTLKKRAFVREWENAILQE